MAAAVKLPAFLAIAGLLAAGCAAPATTTTTEPHTDPPMPPAASGLVALDGCRQFHTFFESPTDGFAEFVPEGFTIKPSETNPQLTTVPVFASDCSNSTEMFALLQVVPPSAYANGSFAVDAVILTGMTTNATDYSTYVAWGLPRMLLADVVSTTTNDAGVAHDEEISVGDGTVTYTLRTLVQADPAPFSATSYRYWAVNGTKATGYAVLDTLPAQTVGTGTAVYSQQGDPGAPPATAGIAHRVDGVAVLGRIHALPAAPGNTTAPPSAA